MASIDEKREHVLKARQTRDHVCHYPGCGKQCKPAFWGCRACWFKIPKFLRDKVWAAYRPGQETTGRPSREYVEVAREVQEWIAANDPEAVRRKAVLVDAVRRKAESSQAGLFDEWGTQGKTGETTMTMPHLMNCKHSGGGWCLECVGELHEKAVKDRILLGSLLALIHRDGGHTSERLGFKGAAKAAEEAVHLDRARLDEALDALLEIEQAGHNPADLFPDLIGLPDRYEKLAARLAERANNALVHDARQKGKYGDAPQHQEGTEGVGAVQDA